MKIIKIQILKNETVIKETVCSETEFQKTMNSYVDIAGGKYNGRDTFIVKSFVFINSN